MYQENFLQIKLAAFITYAIEVAGELSWKEDLQKSSAKSIQY